MSAAQSHGYYLRAKSPISRIATSLVSSTIYLHRWIFHSVKKVLTTRKRLAFCNHNPGQTKCMKMQNRARAHDARAESGCKYSPFPIDAFEIGD